MASLLGQLVRRSGIVLRTSCATQPRTASGLQHVQQCSTTTTTTTAQDSKTPEKGVIRMSKSMQAYQQRAEAHDKFMADQISEYEIGRRHLANMMGEDAETFTQEDIDAAIQYLLPSGLFESAARPAMKHPNEVFTKKKAAEFDMSGRPFHTLFYTGLPSYYQALNDLGKTVISLDQFANRIKQFQMKEAGSQAFNPGSSEWVTKDELEKIFLEHLHDKHYNFFIRSLNRLIEHPYSSRAQDFIMRYRKVIISTQRQQEIPKLMYTAEGIPYMTSEGKRKRTEATVTVYGRGSGKFDINGQDMRFFEHIQEREQVVFPLQFTGLIGKVDIVAKVKGPGRLSGVDKIPGSDPPIKLERVRVLGPSSSAGAIRLATSKALQSFVDDTMREKMRLAGLLTNDFRTKERKKPGQKGARAKYTWKKR